MTIHPDARHGRTDQCCPLPRIPVYCIWERVCKTLGQELGLYLGLLVSGCRADSQQRLLSEHETLSFTFSEWRVAGILSVDVFLSFCVLQLIGPGLPFTTVQAIRDTYLITQIQNHPLPYMDSHPLTT